MRKWGLGEWKPVGIEDGRQSEEKSSREEFALGDQQIDQMEITELSVKERNLNSVKNASRDRGCRVAMLRGKLS